MDFLIDFEAVLEPPTAGEPPKAERAGAVEGVGGGINPPPWDLLKGRISGLVDLFCGFCGLMFGDWGLHALRLSAWAHF